jgi:hypothetical protein
MPKRSIDLSEDSLKTALKIMMAEANVDTFAELARRLEMPETTFRSAINNESMRVSMLLKVAALTGYTLEIKPKLYN